VGGEGHEAGPGRLALAVGALGVVFGSLFFGDSMITPAISVLSAIEGVKVAAPSVSDLVVPITAAIIVGLFLLQRLGTGTVGRLFGPVMGIWFTAIGACGIRGIADHPAILKALSPSYAAGFLTGHFSTAFFSLAAVVLAVTGAEALYADMGHFGRGPITRVWLLLVFPACILSYLGQGALVLGDPAAVASPFFLLVPGWARLPMVFLAGAATVIASQAVISGAFSVTQQAAQIGYLPRLHIAHTSEERIGQVYVPWINWALLAAGLRREHEAAGVLAVAEGADLDVFRGQTGGVDRVVAVAGPDRAVWFQAWRLAEQLPVLEAAIPQAEHLDELPAYLLDDIVGSSRPLRRRGAGHDAGEVARVLDGDRLQAACPGGHLGNRHADREQQRERGHVGGMADRERAACPRS